MMFSMAKKLVAVACAGALAVFAFAGCAPKDTSAQDAQAANRQYMTSVNRCMDDLAEGLEGFSTAVSQGDLVAMRTQVDDALKALDKLAAIEAPEGLLDIQACYVDGCAKLEQALGDYITLSAEVSAATDAQPFDHASYESMIADIQRLYDEGVAMLEKGDVLASEKE